MNAIEDNPADVQAAIEATKKQLLDLQMRKERILIDNKIEFFEPSPKQLEFIEQADKLRRAVFAGNRFGKTTIGVIEDVSYMIGYRPFFPVGHPLRTLGIPKKSVKILVLASDWDNVEALFTNEGAHSDEKGKFFEWCPPGLITHKEKNGQGVIHVIRTASMVDGKLRRSAIYFDTVKSFLMNGLSHESKDWDIIHVDEPIPLDLWTATSRGLIDRNGQSWWLLTPLREPWMYTLFTEKSDHPNYWSTNADMDDNPTLTEEAKAIYLEELDPIERDCRKRGIPLAFGNLVISTYDESRHLWKSATPPAGWKDWITPPRDYYCAYAVDTHPQTPTAVLFVAIAPTGQVFFFHELWIGGLKKDRISEVCGEIKLVRKNLRMGYELLEPAAWNEDPETGRTFADVFEEQNLPVEKASKHRTFAIQQTRMLFGDQNRSVFVFPHLHVLRKELKSWYFTKENKPADKDDHMCENLGRLVVHDNLTWYREQLPYHDGVLVPFDDGLSGALEELQQLSTKFQ